MVSCEYEYDFLIILSHDRYMLLLHDGKGREELFEASGSKPVQFLTPHDSVTVANSGNLMAYSSGKT